MDRDERELLNDITDDVNKVIDEHLDKHCIDRAFFQFSLSCSIMSTNFEKMEEIQLIQDDEPQFCTFCGKMTRFYDRGLDMHLCPKCFIETRKDKKR